MEVEIVQKKRKCKKQPKLINNNENHKNVNKETNGN